MPDVIDSRDLLTELRDLLSDSTFDYSDDPEELHAKHSTEDEDDQPAYVVAWGELDEDERERVQALRAVLSELPGETVDGRNSWGCTMIHKDYFETYAREFADDIGAIEGADRWPNYCIDWKRAARELAQDYTTVEWEGERYFCRD